MNRSRSIVRASSHLFALVLCVWFGSVAAAQVPTTYYVNASCGDDNWSGESPVCQSPDGPKATIQAAVNAASALDTIELADGTYSGAGNKNILIDKDLCIRSESLDPTLCIIDLEEDGRAFRIYGNTSIGLCLIEGITVENGYVLPSGGLQAEPMLPDDEGPEEGNGGAIELYSPATLKNCIFVRNKALRGAGGAIMIGGGGESRILSCVISSNESSFGGGIFAQSTDMSEVRDSVIQNNLAFSFGGGVMCYQYFGEVGRLALVKSIIDENTVGPSSFSNYPHSYGGGVMALTQCEVKIVNGIITNNQAFRSSGNGARGCGIGILSPWGGTDVQLANCVIADNGDDDSNNPTLSLSGGGIWNASGDLTMINCTIARNKTAGTTGAGGGYHHHDFYGGDPDVYIRNTIFWENSVEDGDPEQIALSMFGGHDIVDITNSNVQDGLSGIAGDSPTTYVDNFDEDPLFVNASAGDYRLLYVSPCLNNADPAVLPEDEFDLDEDSDTQEPLPLDLDLNDRQNNPSDCLDIGAYEETTAESCPGDIFDVNGVGPDGEVDQWDLKLVLQKEGTAGGIADVYPWPCGDGIVNDDDADFILQNWGSCGNFNSQLSLPDAIGILVDLLAEYPHLAGPIGSLIQHLLNTWP